jgi:hypothetical protein
MKSSHKTGEKGKEREGGWRHPKTGFVPVSFGLCVWLCCLVCVLSFVLSYCWRLSPKSPLSFRDESKPCTQTGGVTVR